MQSLQADQSLYNRKGVCYLVHVIGRFQVIRRLIFLFVTANILKISIIPAKININHIQSTQKREKRGKWRGIALCNDEKGD